MQHFLKCWPWYLTEIQMGRKTFECRSTKDRVFQAGDTLSLVAFDPATGSMGYEPQTIVDVLAVYHNIPRLAADHCVMSIRLSDSTGD